MTKIYIYIFLHASFPHNCSNYFGQDGKWSELQKDGKLIAQKREMKEETDSGNHLGLSSYPALPFATQTAGNILIGPFKKANRFYSKRL